MSLQSYKPYSRLVSIISGLIIIIAGLDASQVIHIFPEYASQINTILFVAGLIAPVIAQEKRVVRAEDIIKEDYEGSTDSEDITVNITLDGEDILDDSDEEFIDELDAELDESDA